MNRPEPFILFPHPPGETEQDRAMKMHKPDEVKWPLPGSPSMAELKRRLAEKEGR